MNETLAPSLKTAKGSRQDPAGDVMDCAILAGSCNTMISLLQAACLDSVLRKETSLTLLAPTDDAFSSLQAGEIEILLQPRNIDELVSLLSRHIISTELSSSSLATSTVNASTIGREMVSITLQGKWISVSAANGVEIASASVIGSDTRASNGVLMPIDAVILAGKQGRNRNS